MTSSDADTPPPPDRYLIATIQYLTNRHDIALRLLAECDGAEKPEDDAAAEDRRRDEALAALVAREYARAQRATDALASMQARKQRSAVLRKKLRAECDRLCSARAILEKRVELLDQIPLEIKDPYIDGVGAYLQTRHDITLRLAAHIDAELASAEAGGADAPKLRRQRAQLSLELDALLAALQAHESKEELLDSASAVLGEGTPDTSSYLRRVLAYLDARSTIVLRMIAFIDEQLSTIGSPSAVDGPIDTRSHLTRRRAELVAELDHVNEQAAQQKRGEAELRACGLAGAAAADPYHAKVQSFLESRSEMSLQLLAFLESRLADLATRQQQPDAAAAAEGSAAAAAAAAAADGERADLAERRDALRRETDETLEMLEAQKQGQALLESLGCGAAVAAS